MKIRRFAAAAFAAVLLTLRPAMAADARDSVQTLYDTLLDVMKNADKLGYQGRVQKLTPVLDRVFDQALMARIAVGPQWTSLSPDQQNRVIDAFKRLNASAYASNFDGYDGEKFEITGESPTAAGDELVNSRMIRPKDDPIAFNYRLRNENGAWKIIDIFLSGTISQLANYRSEFAATLRSKGPDGLVALIDQKIKDFGPKS
jgi:phospholipid transport system substrate-binding protein